LRGVSRGVRKYFSGRGLVFLLQLRSFLADGFGERRGDWFASCDWDGGAGIFSDADMANGYMPRKDADALAWMQAFSRGLADRPGVFPVTPGEVAAVDESVGRFAAAMAVASDPTRRTTVAVTLKDAARLAAEDACRPIYARIRLDKSVDDTDKIAIGVRPVKTAYARLAAPDTAPILAQGELSWSAYEINYRTSHGVSGRAKPAGATALQVFRAIGDGPATSIEQAAYFRSVSRSPMRVEYTSADNGKTATYFARRVTRKGETGPWSAPLSVRVVSAAPDLTARLAA
jgi:hypothetical protein